MPTRTLSNGQDVPALGLGCWAIGGSFFAGDQPLGWGTVDDSESIRAIHAACDMGLRFFDISDACGTGHSEEILGKALKDRPDAVIATKFGNTHDRATRQPAGMRSTRRCRGLAWTGSISTSSTSILWVTTQEPSMMPLSPLRTRTGSRPVGGARTPSPRPAVASIVPRCCSSARD